MLVLIEVLALSASFAPAGPREPHHILDCMILDGVGKILRRYPGRYCAFSPDGHLVTGTVTDLNFYNPAMQLLKSKTTEIHHQVNLGLDGKTVLVMDSSHHDFSHRGLSKPNVHFDKLAVYDFQGNELKSYDFYENWREIEKIRAGGFNALKPRPGKRRFGTKEWEYSHANSFYELPDSLAATKNPAFKKGNYLVNVRVQGIILVLDRDLKKILWSRVYGPNLYPYSSGHDVQMEPNGKLLIFDNVSFASTEGDFSSITQMDPITGEKEILYQARPPKSFFCLSRGGVQRLKNGNLFISEATNGGVAYEVDAHGKKTHQLVHPEIEKRLQKPSRIQQIKRADLTEFLKNNPGPQKVPIPFSIEKGPGVTKRIH